MKTSPYFAFYASDTMADKRYRSMHLDERGLLISMMCECWVNNTMPSDPDAIGKWLGFQNSEIKAALTVRVLSYFLEAKGELTCPEIEKYREKILAHREKQSKGGKKGANRRWRKVSSDDSLPNSSPNRLTIGRWNEKTRNEKTRTGLPEKAVTNDPWLNEFEANEYLIASKGS